MLVFATADGVAELMLARVVQGLSTGAAVGAVGAGMLDLDRVKGTVANAVAPLIGTATGALLSGLLVQFLPAPTHLVYLVLFGVFVLQGVGVLLMPETSSPRPGALASLRPQFGAAAPRPAGRCWSPHPALVAVWALAGFYGSLGPTLVRADDRIALVRARRAVAVRARRQRRGHRAAAATHAGHTVVL